MTEVGTVAAIVFLFVTAYLRADGPFGVKVKRVVDLPGREVVEHHWTSATNVVIWVANSRLPVSFDVRKAKIAVIDKSHAADFEWLHASDIAMRTHLHNWALGRPVSDPIGGLRRPPKDAYVEEAAVSHKYQAIVWVLDRKVVHETATSGLRKKADTADSHRRYAIRQRSLWLSGLDGSKLRRILDIDTDPQASGPLALHVEWIPEGRFVSFAYRSGIYSLGVD